ncbi:maker176 [Drosophila busckii]|uniref:DNA topoisomerase 1 n=1 Tax=Drosophila busckii TaxID=30019 RepID=A0A0M3QXF7_DROBS|nr:maker176 [Drosophila busckii]
MEDSCGAIIHYSLRRAAVLQQQHVEPIEEKSIESIESIEDADVLLESAEEESLEIIQCRDTESSDTIRSNWHEQLSVSVAGSEDKIKWHSLQHGGPLFPPRYKRLPDNVRMCYNGQPMKLSTAAEEAATWYAKLLGRPVLQNAIFQANFFREFRMLMRPNERRIIKDLELCDFERIAQHLQRQKMSQRGVGQHRKLLEQHHFGLCCIDGELEMIANYRIEPAGIFLGRGKHPLMGALKHRIRPEDVTINCSPYAVPAAPAGHHWKAVQHDQSVVWLARWRDSVTLGYKYMQLSSASRLQGKRELNKFELARRVSSYIDRIRQSYWEDWKSPNLMQRQRGVAIYLIDRVMLRVCSDKSELTADCEGCCRLRVEHLNLFMELQGNAYVVEFNFVGKDCTKYRRQVAVNQHVFENLRSFMQRKLPQDQLFDQLTVKMLNQHLRSLMQGLTAKVFRTYNASRLLQSSLDELTRNLTSPEELLNAFAIAHANAAKFCNHQGAQSKLSSHKRAIRAKQLAISKCRRSRANTCRLLQLQQDLDLLQSSLSDAELRSSVALSTSKVNYVDPRITVAWCKKHKVPIEQVFDAALCSKFDWAITAADASFRF